MAARKSRMEIILDAREERGRLTREQADAQAMKNALTRGDLVRFSEIRKELTELLLTLRGHLLAWSSRMALVVAPESDPAICQAILSKGMHEALSEIADVAGRVEELLAACVETSGSAPASVGGDGRRVGRRKAKTGDGDDSGAGEVEEPSLSEASDGLTVRSKRKGGRVRRPFTRRW